MVEFGYPGTCTEYFMLDSAAVEVIYNLFQCESIVKGNN